MRFLIGLIALAALWYAWTHFDFNKMQKESTERLQNEKTVTRVMGTRENRSQSEQDAMAR